MPKQLDLFTGAPIAPKTTTKTTNKSEAMKKPTTTPTTTPAANLPYEVVFEPIASTAVKVSPAVAAANNRAIQAAAKAIKPAAHRARALAPAKSWEALKLEHDAALTAAAPSATFRPKSAAGLVKVHALGLYIKPAEVAAYHAARRACAIERAAFLRQHYQTAFEAEIRAAHGDEATALAALGINYHDDRGDGLLYAARMQPKHLTAWAAAAVAAGVAASRVRAA